MKHISVNAFREVLEAEKNNDSIDFINVCEPAEYREQHIEGVRSVPLGTVGEYAEEFNSKKTVYIHCKSGNRGRQAIERLQKLGVTAELVNVEGGLLAWNREGHPTNTPVSTGLPLMRQVFIAAGLLTVVGYVAGIYIHPTWHLLAAAVGAGLIFSGISGRCTMAYMLSKMPWNK